MPNEGESSVTITSQHSQIFILGKSAACSENDTSAFRISVAKRINRGRINKSTTKSTYGGTSSNIKGKNILIYYGYEGCESQLKFAVENNWPIVILEGLNSKSEQAMEIINSYIKVEEGKSQYNKTVLFPKESGPEELASVLHLIFAIDIFNIKINENSSWVDKLTEPIK